MDVQALVAADPEHAVASAGRAVARRRPLRHAVEAPVDLAAETGAFEHQERPPSVGARAACRIVGAPPRSNAHAPGLGSAAARPARIRRCGPAGWPSANPTRRQAGMSARGKQSDLLQKSWALRLARDLVGPDLEALQRVRAEGHADRDVGGVAAARDQGAADAGRVEAGVESVPATAEPSLEPAAEIHRRLAH